jgi:hypothetical protein
MAILGPIVISGLRWSEPDGKTWLLMGVFTVVPLCAILFVSLFVLHRV